MKDITDYFISSPEDVNIQKSGTENIEISKNTSEIKVSQTETKSISLIKNAKDSLSVGEILQTTSKPILSKCKQSTDNEVKTSPTTPKSKSSVSKNSNTPRNSKKYSPVITYSPVRSPLEGYNILFNVAKSQSTEIDTSNSKMEKISLVDIEEGNSCDKEISLEMQDRFETSKSNKKQVDAFQILMMSRNKVIGTNSPGKELPEQDIALKSTPKLLARKQLLRSWSDSIQAKKRKLDEDEIDKYIKVKLNTRKERLKSLLHIDDTPVEETENTPRPKRRKHSLKVMKNGKNAKDETIIASKESSKKTPKKVKKELNKRETTSLSADEFQMKIEHGTEVSSSKIHKVKKKSRDSAKLSLTPRTKWKMKIKLIDHDCDKTNNCSKGDGKNDSVEHEFENSVKDLTKIVDGQIASKSKLDKENDIMFVDQIDDPVEEINCQNDTDYQCIDMVKIGEENDTVVLEESESNVEFTDKIDCQPSDSIQTNELISEGLKENNENTRVLRNRTSLAKNKNTDYVYSSSEESDEEDKRKNRRKTLKVAPVFAKAKPKPKVHPEVLEARRKFLMSEMPDELRRRIDKLPSNGDSVEIDFDVFPKVSHVYQEEKTNPLWNLTDPHLKIKTITPCNFEPATLVCKSLIDSSDIQQSRYGESEPIQNIKTILIDIKLEHANYPVYRAFRLLKEKNSIRNELPTNKITPKRGRKARKSAEKKEELSTITDPQNNLKHSMWTEKYKPRSSEDFFGNIQAVSALKKWLGKWREVLDRGKRKRRTYSSDSDSEFVSSDAESIYDRSLSKTVILSGPCGSGKSSSVYAVSKELGLNVLEVNASSRRTGKQILQELQEATQSHQVRKNKGPFTEKAIPLKTAEDEEKNKTRKLCVLLIEDIDIVFEQDEGFISAISQISATSKRPIVLTTTNEYSIYSQRFCNEFKTIRFYSLSFKSLGIWLQILCLLEGIFIDLSSIGELLEYNRGDMRKTLLELQYWTQSGGQINKRKTLLDPIFETECLNEEDNPTPTLDDAPIPLKELDGRLDDYRIHSNILSDFDTFQLAKFNNIPTTIDLKTLWWNIPKFLYPLKPKPPGPSSKRSKKTRKRLKMVSDMYDSAALFDVSYRKIGFKCDQPVCRTRWHNRLQDSLELEENFSSFSINHDMLELNHYLTDQYLDCCRKKFIYESSENRRFLNMAVPGLQKQRQLDNHHKYEDQLLCPVPTVNSLDRKSIVLDYLPSLRTIARTECLRSKNNVKRNNRFHNYLQNLNITCDTPILNFATQKFSLSSCSE